MILTHITLGDLIANFLKDITPLDFVTSFIAGVVGMILMFTIKYERHGKLDPKTPEKFNLRFWIVDNVIRLIRNVITLTVFILFSQPLAGVALSTVFAFIVGLGTERAVKMLKNIGDNFGKKA